MTNVQMRGDTVIDTETLDRLDALLAKAGTRPWQVSDTNEGTMNYRGWEVTNDAFHNPPASVDEPWTAVELHTGIKADADLIAELVNAASALLAAARQEPRA